jgi:SAM-dependent methyltransferase
VSAASGERWFESAFRADYLRVYPHRDLESARREVDFLIERGIGGRVLDLCCGFGRHSMLLSERGVRVTGLDLSFDLLRAASRLQGFDAHLAGRLVRGDAIRLPFRDASFDGVVNLFSSFGYFGPSNDERVLAEVARTTKSGGLAMFDLMNPSRVRATLVAQSRRSGEGFELVERRSLAEGGRRVVKDVELLLDGERRAWREDVRLYELDEFESLAERAALTVRARWGDFDRSAHCADSPRMIVETVRARSAAR